MALRHLGRFGPRCLRIWKLRLAFEQSERKEGRILAETVQPDAFGADGTGSIACGTSQSVIEAAARTYIPGTIFADSLEVDSSRDESPNFVPCLDRSCIWGDKGYSCALGLIRSWIGFSVAV